MSITIVQQAYPADWVKLNKYCDLTGDTPDAVYAKRNKGLWVEGTHSQIGPDGKLWINLPEVQKWVTQGTKATQQALNAQKV